MVVIALVLSILLVNRVKLAQISVTAASLKPDEERGQVDLGLQIRQIQTTSEDAPAAATGNNLDATESLNENPQAIHAIYPSEEKGANKESAKEGNGQFATPFDGSETDIKNEAPSKPGNHFMLLRNKNIRPQTKLGNSYTAPALVWDSCLENKAKDAPRNNLKTQNDMENESVDIKVDIDRRNPNSWSKRNINNSEALEVWLEKLNNFTKTHPKTPVITSADEISSTLHATEHSTVVRSIPITKDIFEEETTQVYDDLLQEKDMENQYDPNDIGLGQTEDWIEVQGGSKINFDDLPRTENYLITTLKLEGGFNPFTFMSEFFSWIYPFEIPAEASQFVMNFYEGRNNVLKSMTIWTVNPSFGMEGPRYGHSSVSKSQIHQEEKTPEDLRVSNQYLGDSWNPLQNIIGGSKGLSLSIELESVFLWFIIAFCCIALVIPSYLFVLCILSMMSRSDCDDADTGTLFSEAKASDCNDRVVVVGTLLVLLMCCMLISGMAVSNEQASSAASAASYAVSCACADVATWLAAAARELHHSIVPPVDLVLQAFREDLRNVETLLGGPIQQSIASESGIDLVLDSLKDIINESEDLSSKISSLRDMGSRAGKIASTATDKVRDLARQLDNLKKNCNFKDTPLCDTVNTNSLEVSMRFDLILREQRLLELRSLGVVNLTRSISTAKQDFRALSSIVAAQTTEIKEVILRDIELHRQEVHSSSRIISDIARHLSATLHTGMRQLQSSLDRIQEYEFWRWSFMLGSVVFIGFVLMMMVMGMLCGCGKAKGYAKRTLQLSTVWMCLASLALWGVISVLFLIAGHAEVFICRALWDFPRYKTLSALLDRPSPLMSNNEGVFDALFRDLENVTIDVSIKDVLRDCESDHTAYSVFRLDRVLDVNKETSYFEWEDLRAGLKKLPSSIDVGYLKTLSKYFNKLLSEMLEISDVNLASYRMNYNGPIVGKDLPSLADQLENVAAQVTDLTTAGRLETLATRTKRLQITSIKPLEQLRADLVFKLTELELQLQPFRRKLNISLSHIHTAQFYIDNQGDVIAQKKAFMFVSRLESHAAAWRTHVLEATEKHAARCRPLFDVYAGLRGLFCSRYVASLHGWWVCGFLLGVIWCTALTPLCVKLWRSYDRRIRDDNALTLQHLGPCQQGTPITAVCDSGNWTTPEPPPLPRNDSW